MDYILFGLDKMHDYGATGNVVREFQKNIFLTIKGNKISVYIDCVVFLHFDRMIGQITSSHKEHVGPHAG